MTKDILIEKQAPLIGSLYHFCKKANYKICPTDKQISDELSTYINKMLADTENIFYSYDTIPTFEHYKIKEMEQIIGCIGISINNFRIISTCRWI